jgi:hypothetical protein
MVRYPKDLMCARTKSGEKLFAHRKNPQTLGVIPAGSRAGIAQGVLLLLGRNAAERFWKHLVGRCQCQPVGILSCQRSCPDALDASRSVTCGSFLAILFFHPSIKSSAATVPTALKFSARNIGTESRSSGLLPVQPEKSAGR